MSSAAPSFKLTYSTLFDPPPELHRRFEDATQRANASEYGLTAGFYGGADEIDGFLGGIEAGVAYVNRPQGATTGAWPGYQPFGGWKASGATGKGTGSFYYVQQYLREQSQTVVE